MEINKLAVLNYNDTDTLKDEHVESLQKVLPGTEIIVARSTSKDGAKPLLEQTKDADVLLTWGYETPGLVDFCKGAKSLKWIHCFTSGVDGIMASDIAKMDVKVTSSKGVAGYAIADHVLAFMYAFVREIPLFMQLKQEKKRIRDNDFYRYDEIAFKTAGIVGLGAVGRIIADKCKKTGMRVLGADLFPDNGLTDKFYQISELDKMLEECDFVVLSVPLTDDTRNLISEKQFKIMKNNAYLINVARGEVVNTSALVKAINEKEIAGAGLDVLEGENNMQPDNPIWELPNVIYTPHIAAMSPHYMDRAIQVTIDNITRYLKDEKLLFQAK